MPFYITKHYRLVFGRGSKQQIFLTVLEAVKSKVNVTICIWVGTSPWFAGSCITEASSHGTSYLFLFACLRQGLYIALSVLELIL